MVYWWWQTYYSRITCRRLNVSRYCMHDETSNTMYWLHICWWRIHAHIRGWAFTLTVEKLSTQSPLLSMHTKVFGHTSRKKKSANHAKLFFFFLTRLWVLRCKLYSAVVLEQQKAFPKLNMKCNRLNCRYKIQKQQLTNEGMHLITYTAI